MTDEEYNGWTNYETWLMDLNLTNEQGIYNDVRDLIQEIRDNDDMENWDIAQELKQYIEDTYWHDETNVVMICDTWTLRNFQEINWLEIVESFIEE